MKKFVIGLVCIFICALAKAATETINWYVDGNTYATTTCQTGGDITLPTAPTKYGYTFHGWADSYVFLEYIESTGIQYIDTGYTFNTEHKLILNVKPSNDSLAWFFGANANAGEVIIGKRDNLYFGGLIGSGVNIFPTSKYYNIIMDTNHTDTSLVVDDNIVFTGSKNFNSRNILLFAYIPGTAEGINGVSTQISSFKMYQKDGTLVQNLIPAKRTSDNVLGMYDTVTDTFFTNAGTGEFIAGPVINQ